MSFRSLNGFRRKVPRDTKKSTSYTRYGTVLLCAIQSMGSNLLDEVDGVGEGNGRAEKTPGIGFNYRDRYGDYHGYMIFMWLGEVITEPV